MDAPQGRSRKSIDPILSHVSRFIANEATQKHATHVRLSILFGDGTKSTVTIPVNDDREEKRCHTLPNSTVDDQIIAFLETVEKPVKSRTIAAKLNLTFNSYFRGRLAGLVRDGALVLIDRVRYWPATRLLNQPAPQA